MLNASDAYKIRGFVTNDTHFNWVYKEIAHANKVSKLTGGLHFVIDTRADGQGPKRNPHPVTQGVEELCNPPGRGLGPEPGASNGATSTSWPGESQTLTATYAPAQLNGATPVVPSRPRRLASRRSPHHDRR